jgi:glycosyltransferase involved in cell wall biosynthesis
MKISLACPVYNESQKIQEFIHRSVKSLKSISEDIEFVLVNDCSPDDTLDKIKELLPQYTFIKLINLNKNSGQHIATSIALQYTTGEYIFMMDSDLQVNPEYLPAFFEKMQHMPNCDIISALRITRSNKISRRLGSKAISLLLQLIGNSKLKDIGSTFKLFKRKALNKILANDILVQNLPILMMNLNLNIIEYPIEYINKQDRKSHYKLIDLVSAIFLALLNFSTGARTLMVLIICGVLLSFIGLTGLLGIILWGMMYQSILPTNLLLFCLILMVIGIQFLLLSMIVFKIERVNKNLDFKKSINQRIEYEY